LLKKKKNPFLQTAVRHTQISNGRQAWRDTSQWRDNHWRGL